MNSPINIKSSPYNAYGDGVHDDSAAILAAINAACTVIRIAKASVYAPAGIYLLKESAALTQTLIDHHEGVHFYGDGMEATIFRLAPTASDLYFYDPGATPRMQCNSYSDIGFQGMNPANFTGYASIPSHSKGFRLWATSATGSHEQNFHFTRCMFSYLNIAFDTEGDNTTSENTFVQCEFVAVNTVMSLNNPQSFNHEFHGSNLTEIYGNAFVVSGNGGGAIKMFGGSVIMLSDSGVNTYFFYSTGSSGIGGEPFAFIGVRMELRGNYTNLASVPDFAQIGLKFDNMLFEDQGEVIKSDWCSIGAYNNILFSRCDFYETIFTSVRFAISSSSLYGESGCIKFDNCNLPVDWSDRCSINLFGRISAHNCAGTNIGANIYGAQWAHDFDLGGSPSNNGLNYKVGQIKTVAEYWPSSSGAEWTLKLPLDAILKSIKVVYPGGLSGMASPSYLRISNNDCSIIHAVVDIGDGSVSGRIGLDDYFYSVGSAINDRTLRLSFGPVSGPSDYTGVGGSNNGGVALIEYI